MANLTTERPGVYRPPAIESPAGSEVKHTTANVASPRLAKALGWFSLGLGVPQVLAPGAMNRLTGVDDTPTTRNVMRMVGVRDRKSTRLNSSHANISYAVFCL